MSEQKPCYLRKTELVLADGKTYSFRAIPLSRKTMPLVRALVDDSAPDTDKLAALVEAIELSLSYDQSPEEVQEIMDSGLVSPGNKEVLNAMVAGLS
jgi:hypothetical protein